MRDLAHSRVVHHSPETTPPPTPAPLTIGGSEVNGHGEIDLRPKEEKTCSHLGRMGGEQRWARRGGKTAGHPCLSGMWLQGSRLCASSGKLERLQQACPRGARPLGALGVSIPEPTGTDYVLWACMVLWVAVPSSLNPCPSE